MKNTSLKEILDTYAGWVVNWSDGIVGDAMYTKMRREALAQITQHFEACVPEKMKIDVDIPDTLHRNIGFNKAVEITINNIKGAK